MELDEEDYELLGWGIAIDKTDIKKNNLNLTKKTKYDKEYRQSEHGKKLAKQHQNTYMNNLKENPERYRNYLDKVAARMRKYRKKKKEERGTNNPKT